MDLTRRVPLCVAGFLALAGVTHAQAIPPSAIAGLQWRNIGPFRGGRVSAVAGVVSQPSTFYIGLPQGGVWKSTSAGTTWFPVFDGVKDQSAIGSIAVAQSNPDVVYAGTGEISGGGRGDGLYRSADGGKSWTKVGLEGTNILPALMVDPKDENLVLAAATGNASEANDKRGVYRSTDGGKSWTKTLNINSTTGAQHLAWAYDNPKVVIATTSVRFYGPRPGDPKGPPPKPELFKSTDEGLTWKKLTQTGLPELTGRITVAVAQGTNSQRMYLIGTFGLYRSDDGGQNWRKMAVDDPRIINGQGEYSSGVYVDAYDPDLVYTIATAMYRSTDGGKTFIGFKGAPGGDDPQQIWIDPVNKGHILYGGDQGATVSLDAGATWSSWYNQITAQVYHIVTDTRFPYWVYATQQDSGTIAMASAGALGQITQFDWFPHPGNEGGYLAPDPLNPAIVYGPGFYGGINRITAPSYQSVQVDPSPLLMGPGFGSGQFMFSPANPREMLTSSRRMLSSMDGGIHWRAISPDLASTGTKDRMEEFASISSFSPSPVAANVLWVRTNRGRIQVTTDHGNTWANVTPPAATGGKPLAISCLEASGTDRASAYAMVSDPNEKNKDAQVQFYRTNDFGKTWRKSPGFRCSNLRADRVTKGLIFSQNNDEVRFTVDDGEHWQNLNLNMPKTGFTDIQLHGNDLVLGTFGRGIWILDDYSPLRQMATLSSGTHLFRPATAIRMRRNQNLDTPLPPEVPRAPNPLLGVSIYYALASKPAGEVTLDIFDARGEKVRHYSSVPTVLPHDPRHEFADYWAGTLPILPTEAGLNRFNWDCRYDSPHALTNNVDDTMQAVVGQVPPVVEGPLVAPGNFKAVLTVNGQPFTQPLEVANDPRSNVPTRELAKVLDMQKRYIAGAKEAVEGYNQADALLTQANALVATHPVKEVADAATALATKVQSLRGNALNRRRAYGPPDPDAFANLNIYLILQMDMFSYGDAPLTDLMLATYGADWTKLKTVSDSWRKVKKTELAKLNEALKKNRLAVLAIPTDLQDPVPPAKQFLPAPKTGEARQNAGGNLSKEEREREQERREREGEGEGDGD